MIPESIIKNEKPSVNVFFADSVYNAEIPTNK